jgi:hypothetical protein
MELICVNRLGTGRSRTVFTQSLLSVSLVDECHLLSFDIGYETHFEEPMLRQFLGMAPVGVCVFVCVCVCVCVRAIFIRSARKINTHI